MSANVNNGESVTKRRGPVWQVKVEIFYPVFQDSKIERIEIKRWKIREILN